MSALSSTMLSAIVSTSAVTAFSSSLIEAIHLDMPDADDGIWRLDEIGAISISLSSDNENTALSLSANSMRAV